MYDNAHPGEFRIGSHTAPGHMPPRWRAANTNSPVPACTPIYLVCALEWVEHVSRTTDEVLTSAKRYLLCHGAFLGEKKEVSGCVIHRKRTSGSGDSV